METEKTTKEAENGSIKPLHSTEQSLHSLSFLEWIVPRYTHEMN